LFSVHQANNLDCFSYLPVESQSLLVVSIIGVGKAPLVDWAIALGDNVARTGNGMARDFVARITI
jgi:hypothetical protein